MGCSIVTVVEKLGSNGWCINESAVFTYAPSSPDVDTESLKCAPFIIRNYTMFALLAGVRNEQRCITPIAPKRGLPEDASDEALAELLGSWDAVQAQAARTVADKIENRADPDMFGFSWLNAAELFSVDYDQQIVWSAAAGSSLREALCDRFFKHLEQLKMLGDPGNVRVLFGFS